MLNPSTCRAEEVTKMAYGSWMLILFPGVLRALWKRDEANNTEQEN